MDSSIYRLRDRDLLTLCVLSLLLLGVIMVQSASATLSGWGIVRLADGSSLTGDIKSTGDSIEIIDGSGKTTQVAGQRVWSIERTGHGKWEFSAKGRKHLIFAAAAVVTFLAIGHLDYRKLTRVNVALWRSTAVWAIVLAALACVAVLVPGLGREVNGARRWIVLGPVQIQPSEMAKWAAVVFLAWWMARRPVNLDRFAGYLLTVSIIGVLCLLVVIEDFGTAALIGVGSLAMLVVGGARLWHLAVTIPPALLGAFWFVRHEPYRWTRMTAFLDPWAAPQGVGYHMVQSLLSFSTGGIFGRGLGNGIQKLGYLPEDTTDFIFAVICEELGLFGALLTIALYLGIFFVAWQALRQRKGTLGPLLAFGVAAMLGLQAIINMAVATVSVPTKGLSLPLVSAGGSGLIITCAALGLLYSVARLNEATEPATSTRTAPEPCVV